MEQMKCPGQDTRYWKPGDIFVTECPKCSAEIEFFKDDTRRRCAWCGHPGITPGYLDSSTNTPTSSCMCSSRRIISLGGISRIVSRVVGSWTFIMTLWVFS